MDTQSLTLAGVITSRSVKMEQELIRGAKRVGTNEAIAQASPALSPSSYSHPFTSLAGQAEAGSGRRLASRLSRPP
jgi:hypothetical protein